MNKKGFELAISTIIILIIGLLALAGLIFMLNGGFDRFSENTDIISASSENSLIVQACEISCSSNDKFSYCCNEFDISDKAYKCRDIELDSGCFIDCSSFRCP